MNQPITEPVQHTSHMAGLLSSTQPGTEPCTTSRMQGFHTACWKKLNELKDAITNRLASEFQGMLQPEKVRRAVDEAEAVATLVPFSALFLPVLAEERVIRASRWEARQQRVRRYSLALER